MRSVGTLSPAGAGQKIIRNRQGIDGTIKWEYIYFLVDLQVHAFAFTLLSELILIMLSVATRGAT